MVAYLAIKPDHVETRERLAGLLWSDRTEDQARASLRQCIKQLREGLADQDIDFLEATRNAVELRPNRVSLDLNEAARQIEQGRFANLLQGQPILPERILYGFETVDEAYAAWLHVVRERWRTTLSGPLQEVLQDPQADRERRFQAARLLVGIDPTHEHANRVMIETLAQTGQKSAAIRQYDQLWALLDRDFDMEPEPETQDLIVRVKSGEFDAAAAEAPASAPTPPASAPTSKPAEVGVPVLAVAAFDKPEHGSVSQHLMDGFRRDLIANLVRFREWIIVEGQLPQRQDAAGRTAAEYQLEGGFVSDGGQTKVIMTLKHAATGRFIWSEQHTLGLDNWFAAQQHVVRRMSAGLNVYLSAERVADQVRHADMPLQAYDLWLRGNDMFWSWRPESRSSAERLFREVIELTPDFAPAYAGIASIYNTRHAVTPGVFRVHDLSVEAAGFARRAVQLDPLDARGQIALAWSSAMTGRFDQAELYFALTHDLNPNNPTTVVSCANGLALCGEERLARELDELALRINPLMAPFQWSYLVGPRFLRGDLESCVQAAELAQNTIPIVPGWRAAALGLLGRTAEAEEAAAEFLAFTRSRWSGPVPASDENAVHWFLHNFPFRRPADAERLREGLRAAGLRGPS